MVSCDADGFHLKVCIECSPLLQIHQILVLPTDIDCATFQECQMLELQRSMYVRSHETKPITSTRDLRESLVLLNCEIGKPNVTIRAFVQTSPETLDAPADLQSLQSSFPVQCKPCQQGWQRVQTVNAASSTWTCQKCKLNQYVVDPNVHLCRDCPEDGAQCDGARLIPKVDGSVWSDDTNSGFYRIQACPAGFIVIRDESRPELDQCYPCR